MANAKVNGGSSRYASIDTAPGAEGYFSDSVGITHENASPLFFSRRSGAVAGVGTITIQFKCPGDTDWTDYLTDLDLSVGARHIIDDEGAGVSWRAGVKQGDYTSGVILVGLDWGRP